MTRTIITLNRKPDSSFKFFTAGVPVSYGQVPFQKSGVNSNTRFPRLMNQMRSLWVQICKMFQTPIQTPEVPALVDDASSPSFYESLQDLDYDLGEGIYHVLADTPNLDRAIEIVEAFEEKFESQPLPFLSEDEREKIDLLIRLVHGIYQLDYQMETEPSQKEGLKKIYQDKITLLSKNAPAMTDELLNLDTQYEYYQKINEEALRLFPDDSEARADYLERF